MYYSSLFRTLDLMTDQRNSIQTFHYQGGTTAYIECQQQVMQNQIIQFENDTFVENFATLFLQSCAIIKMNNCNFVNNYGRKLSVSMLGGQDFRLYIQDTVFTNDNNYTYSHNSYNYNSSIDYNYVYQASIAESKLENINLFLDNVSISNYHNISHRRVFSSLFYFVKPELVSINNVYFYNNTNVSFLKIKPTDLTDFSITHLDISIQNCLFENSSLWNNHHTFNAHSENYGYNLIELFSHGLHSKMTNVTFRNIIMANNYSLMYIFQAFHTNAEFYHINIDNCTTFMQVPLLHLDCDFEFEDSIFLNNKIDYGIVSSYDDFSRFDWSFINCVFKNNIAASRAGAIYNFQNSLKIIDSIFDNNYAKYMGGDIVAFGDKTEIYNCTFINSKSNDSAGSIWIGQGYATEIALNTTIIGSTFKNISAPNYGGVILHETSNINYIHINNNVFIGCSAAYGPVLNVINTDELELDTDNDWHNNNDDDDDTKSVATKDLINVNGNQMINNTGTANPYELISLPYRLLLEHDIDSEICPNCPINIELRAIDLFGQEWIPYSVCNQFIAANSGDYDDSDCLTVELLHAISSEMETDMIDDHAFEFEISHQSSLFLQGSGNETLIMYPLPFGERITMTISSQIASIKPASIEAIVGKCLSHYSAEKHESDHAHFDHDGVELEYFQCVECDYGRYRLKPTMNESCLNCPNNIICNGGNDIYVFEDYYVAENDYQLHAFQCLKGACCQETLCKVDVDSLIGNKENISNLCPSNRDATSPLCSACVSGTSAVQGTQQCFECDNMESSPNTWIAFGMFILMYGLITYLWGEVPPQSKKKEFWNLVLFRICMPFYQILSFIQLQNIKDYSIDDGIIENNENEDESEFLDKINSIVEGYFNVEIPHNYQFYVCVMSESSNVHRLLVHYVTPILCVILVGLHLLIKRVINKIAYKNTVLTSPNIVRRQNLNIVADESDFELSRRWTEKKYYYSSAFVNCTSLIYSQVIKTSFQLITCRSVTINGITHSIMFYDGTVECLQSWHAVPITLIILCLFIPAIVTYILYFYHQIGVSHIENGPKAWFGVLALPYKPQYCYFEGYRMLRIFALALLLCLDIDEYERLFFIRCLVMCFITIHVYCYPFHSKKYKFCNININHLETCSLYLLFLLTMLADFHRSVKSSNHELIELLFNGLSVIPFIVCTCLVLAYQSVKQIKKRRRMRMAKNEQVLEMTINLKSLSDDSALEIEDNESESLTFESEDLSDD